MARRMSRFEVPGGHIDVSQEEDGTLRVHGVNEVGTHTAQLTLRPESGNDISVSLTPLPVAEMEWLHGADVVPGSEEDLIRRGL